VCHNCGVTRDRAAERLRDYTAIRADADALASEVRAYRERRGQDQTPRALDLALIRHFQRRLSGIRARWETAAATQPA
jgi:hypothetical protein